MSTPTLTPTPPTTLPFRPMRLTLLCLAVSTLGVFTSVRFGARPVLPPAPVFDQSRTQNHLRIPSIPSPAITGDHTSAQVAVEEEDHALPKGIDFPLCRPKLPPAGTKIRRISFGHMRKAAGTTLRAYLDDLSARHNLTFSHHEGRPYERPGTRNDTLYVTLLRDPLARIKSSFQFEGRWDCGDVKRRRMALTLNNTRANNFLDWVQTAEGDQCNKKSRWFWICTNECHIRWLANPVKHCSESTMDDIYDTALEAAQGQHIIIWAEMLRNENYTKAVEAYFGQVGFEGLHADAKCGPEMRLANQQYPYHYDAQELDAVRALNSHDYKFYNRLTDCGPDGIQFPNTGTEASSSSPIEYAPALTKQPRNKK